MIKRYLYLVPTVFLFSACATWEGLKQDSSSAWEVVSNKSSETWNSVTGKKESSKFYKTREELEQPNIIQNARQEKMQIIQEPAGYVNQGKTQVNNSVENTKEYIGQEVKEIKSNTQEKIQTIREFDKKSTKVYENIKETIIEDVTK